MCPTMNYMPENANFASKIAKSLLISPKKTGVDYEPTIKVEFSRLFMAFLYHCRIQCCRLSVPCWIHPGDWTEVLQGSLPR